MLLCGLCTARLSAVAHLRHSGVCVCVSVMDCKPKGGNLVALHNVSLFRVCPVRLNRLHILTEMSLDVCVCVKGQLTWLGHMTLGDLRISIFIRCA